MCAIYRILGLPQYNMSCIHNLIMECCYWFLKLLETSLLSRAQHFLIYNIHSSYGLNYSSLLIQFLDFFQPAGDSMTSTGLLGPGRHPALSPGANNVHHSLLIGFGTQKDKIQHNHQMPSIGAMGGGHGAAGNQLRGDDGSSGYGSPDSETFEVPANQ